jgi:pimeloyl-ACP methyl ester carboxylesterase
MVFADYLRCGPRWYLREVAAMLAYPTHEQIRRLTRPLLIVRGANDPVATASWCDRLAALAGGGGVTVSIPGHRHVVVHTAPEDVALAVTTFVARTEAARGTSAIGG